MMARNNIRIDQLANEIINAVRDYTDEVSAAVSEAVDQTAKECVAEIKANSPRKTGNYAKGWKVVKKDGPGYINRTIWNPKHYRLVHLLEKGHAKRGGGRVAGRPHVGPAEQRHITKLTNRIERIIRNGGR